MTTMTKTISNRKTLNLSKKTVGKLLRIATHIGSLIPLAVLIWRYQTDRLGVDVVREILLDTGITSLILLMLSLACTPANTLFGWKQLLPLRKPLGLYAFFYVTIHFLTFTWLDYLFDLEFILDAIVEQKYVLIGFSAFLLLIPLAATSTRWAQRKLGKNWKKLHKLTYLIIIFALIHFFWLVKNVYTRPAVYAVLVGLLLLTRITPIRKRLTRWRQHRRSRKTVKKVS